MASHTSLRFLLLLIGPALVLLLIVFVSELILSMAAPSMAAELLAQAVAKIRVLERLPSNYIVAAHIYVVSFGLLVLVSVPTVAYSLWIMTRVELPGGRLAAILALLVAVAFTANVFVSWGRFAAAEAYLAVAPTLEALPRELTKVPVESRVSYIDSWSQVFFAWVATFVAFAAASCVSIRRDAEHLQVADLAQRMAWLRIMLYLGAGALVIGLASTWSLYQLPLGLLETGEAEKAIQNLGLARQIFFGFAFTALLATIYVPPALVIRMEAAAMARRLESEGAIASAQSWLAEHALAGASGITALYRLLAIFAPLLAALFSSPISALLGN